MSVEVCGVSHMLSLCIPPTCGSPQYDPPLGVSVHIYWAQRLLGDYTC